LVFVLACGNFTTEAGICLYYWTEPFYEDDYSSYGSKKMKRGTPRPDLKLSTCLLEDYKFDTPSLQDAVEMFKNKIINERKGAFKDMFVQHGIFRCALFERCSVIFHIRINLDKLLS
jgi:hypothetical protein